MEHSIAHSTIVLQGEVRMIVTRLKRHLKLLYKMQRVVKYRV